MRKKIHRFEKKVLRATGLPHSLRATRTGMER